MHKVRLLIISDSPMWKLDNKVFVFEPTLREVEWLADNFESITWIGFNFGSLHKSFARETIKSNVNFIPLRHATGGSSFVEKLKILPHLPLLCAKLIKIILQHQYVHTRGPSVPALIAILFSYFDRNRNYWHKYAGNWMQKDAPCAYALQRYLLRKSKHIVSVNGHWPGDPTHVLNLENPCIAEVELETAFHTRKNISTDRIVLCFIGALTPSKGIWEFLRAIFLLKYKDKIETVYIAGDGPDRNELEILAGTLKMSIQFLGNLKRNEINLVYQRSDIIVLPTANEGFPKVIAEAAAFGCVPIVSDVSSIGQYIKDGVNGILLTNIKPESIARAIDLLLKDSQKRQSMSKVLPSMATLFTYERYCKRVVSEIYKL